MTNSVLTARIDQEDDTNFRIWVLDREMPTFRIPEANASLDGLDRWFSEMRLRRKEQARDQIMANSEVGKFLAVIPPGKMYRYCFFRKHFNQDTWRGEWRVGFRVKFTDPSFAMMFKLRFAGEEGWNGKVEG